MWMLRVVDEFFFSSLKNFNKYKTAKRKKKKTRLYTYSFIHRGALIQGQDVTWLSRLFVMENRFQTVEHLAVPKRRRTR